MNHEDIERRLQSQSDVAVPPADLPELSCLKERVAARRRQRRVIRAGATCTTLFVVAIGALAWWDRSANQTLPIRSPIADTVPTENPTPQTGVTPIAVPIVPSSTPRQTKRPRIQLYATVRQPLPVFDIDQKTKAIHHIGWVDSEQSLPLDMRYVPQNQQETFNAALTAGDHWTIDL